MKNIRNSGVIADIGKMIARTGKTMKEVAHSIGMDYSSLYQAVKRGNISKKYYTLLEDLMYDIRSIDEFNDTEIFEELKLRGYSLQLVVQK